MNTDNMSLEELELLATEVRVKIEQKTKEENPVENFMRSEEYKPYKKEYIEISKLPKTKVVINVPIELTIEPVITYDDWEDLSKNNFVNNTELNTSGKSLFKGTRAQQKVLNECVQYFCENACHDILYFFPDVKKEINNRAAKLMNMNKEIGKINPELSIIDLGVQNDL